jgi:hypothetical protein
MTNLAGRVARLAAVAAACAAALSAGGCLMTGDADGPTGQPAFYRSMAGAGVKLDAASAQSMISGYRKNNGLSAVTLDPKLMKIAEEHAQAMAASNKMDHTINGRTFQQRIDGSGYRARVAAENVGAGYHTLAEAFSGWRDSASHKRNMLLSGATHMGIAAVYAPQSKYKVFWALVLAAEDDRRASDGFSFQSNMRPVAIDAPPRNAR